MPFQKSFLIAEIEPDLTIIKEAQLKTTSISTSPYAKRYRDAIDQLLKNIRGMIKFFGLWKNLQKLWAYMTPIFFDSDLPDQMPR